MKLTDAVTDTHGLIWYLEDDPRLGPEARAVFDACDRGEVTVYVPTMCLVEIVFLQEKNRISATLRGQLEAELQAADTGLVLADLTADVADAMARVPRAEVPEMPDRVIAATALQLGLPLLSRDHKIQASVVSTLW